MRYATNEPNGYGWNATIGDDRLAVHMSYSKWGWNARGCSSLYLGVEFAQATVDHAISDAQVRAFCWFVQQARGLWPELPLLFPTHAELDGTAAYGNVYDGKTDCFPKGDLRSIQLRQRITARLATLGV